jgi:transcriptional regulator with GAF, ATPase, and Fis domain
VHPHVIVPNTLTDPLQALAAGDRVKPEEVCRALAGMFGVREHEVALLRIDGQFLRFVYPPPLDKVGCIPLSNSSSVAARTALLRRPELFNNFTAVKHASIFESVPLQAGNQAPIHKLMSVPLIWEHEVVGVLQLCRKGNNAGADFTRDDLHKLLQVSRVVAKTVV